jgi:fibro-slime domain-containing protein
MTAVVRDFRGSNETDGHPDFESFEGKAPTTGLLAEQLGSDSKPVYASHCEATPDKALCPFGQMTTSEQAFDQWYRTTPGVNDAYVVYLMFQANGDVYTFQSNEFFPLDGSSTATLPGKGNHKMKYEHDFGFTTELHAEFLYKGGEQFSFTGDDDLWVFVNGKLAIDLGGLHPPATGTLDLDASAKELGLKKDETYPLDLFHAERHTNASNFRVDTTLGFTACGEITPEVF